MIAIQVQYHNMLRRHAGIRRETLTLPAGSTLGQALAQIGDHHGPSLREMLFSAEGEIASHLVVFCQGKLVHGDRAAHRLSDGDELLLFPVISGG